MNKTISLLMAAALSTTAYADDGKHEMKHHVGGQMNHADMNHDHGAEHDHGASHEHESHDHEAMSHDILVHCFCACKELREMVLELRVGRKVQ